MALHENSFVLCKNKDCVLLVTQLKNKHSNLRQHITYFFLEHQKPLVKEMLLGYFAC